MSRSSSILTTPRVAALLLAAAGIIHLVLAPEYLAEAPIIGALFLLSVPSTLLPAVMIWRSDDRRAWIAGALVDVGMILGFVLSRTVGLLGYQSDEWAEGIPALAVEAAFVMVMAYATTRRTTASAAPRMSGTSLR